MINTEPPAQVAKLPFVINDGKWHHLCITWTTRDGMWEAFQDGVMRGSGENLAPYHPIKPEGVLVLGQEQVGDSLAFQRSQLVIRLNVGIFVKTLKGVQANPSAICQPISGKKASAL